jgi:hypothetical protein
MWFFLHTDAAQHKRAHQGTQLMRAPECALGLRGVEGDDARVMK